MIRNHKELEERVLEYAPELRDKIRLPGARDTLEEIAENKFETYKPYLHKGVAGTMGTVGRGLGYLGDVVFWGSRIAAATNPLLAPYMLTGLLLKKGNLAGQVLEAGKTFKYWAHTKDTAGSLRNLAAKVVSYIPGLTFVDTGLAKIAEKRMIKQTAYELSEALGEKAKSWYVVRGEQAQKAGYKEAQVRTENIVRPSLPDKGARPLRKAA